MKGSEEKPVVMENLLWKNSITVVASKRPEVATLFAINVAAHVRAGQDFMSARFRVPEPRRVSYNCHEDDLEFVLDAFAKIQRTLGVSDLDIPVFAVTRSGALHVHLVSDLPAPSAIADANNELRVMDVRPPGGKFDPSWAFGFQKIASPDESNPEGCALLVVWRLGQGEKRVPKDLADAAETVLVMS